MCKQEEGKEMITFVIDHSKEVRIVHPNPLLADKINLIAKSLLRMMKNNRYSNDDDATFRFATTDRAFRSTRPRPTNNTVVSKAGDVKAVEDMIWSQTLRACIRIDVVGKKRLCHTRFHKGLFILSHLTPDSVPPSVADLIPGTVRT